MKIFSTSLLYLSTTILLTACNQNTKQEYNFNTSINLSEENIQKYNKGEEDIKNTINNFDSKSAIKRMNKIIRENPKNSSAYYERGIIKTSEGKLKSAIKDYTKAIELDPNNFQAYVNRANNYSDLDIYIKALYDYNKALEINPKDANIYYNKGLFRLRNQHYPEAIKNFTKAIKLIPNFANAYFDRGQAKAYLKKYRSAIKDFNKTIEINPKDYRAHLQKGLVKIMTNDESGCEDFKKGGELAKHKKYDIVRNICARMKDGSYQNYCRGRHCAYNQ